MIDVSIILPTYNGIRYIEEVMQALFRQRTRFSYEVIVVDSGSSDGTKGIVQRFPVRFLQIEQREFGHGKTRNFAARQAAGRYLVFLTQDATPAHDRWLEELILGFGEDPLIACVFGKQIPRPECDPVTKRDLELHFDAFLDSDTGRLQQIEDTPEGWADYARRPYWYGFNSNVNSAIRKEVWEKVPFRDVIYTEDQLLGRDLILSGYKKRYAPQAAVIHSHQYDSFVLYFKRFFDELRGMEMAFGYREEVKLLTFLPETLRSTWHDARYLWRDATYSFWEKLYWIHFRLWFNLARRGAAYFGERHRSLPACLKRHFSLEKNEG